MSSLNPDIDFSSKTIETLKKASIITVIELIDYINVNNRRRVRIDPIDTSTVESEVFSYFFQHFDFEKLIVNDNLSLSKNLEIVLKKFDTDTHFLEILKDLIKHTANPLRDEYENQGYVPTTYEDFTFFSLDVNSLLDKIDLSLNAHSGIELNQEFFTTNSLEKFDVGLYQTIITSPKLIHSISWRDFEYILAKILASFEYEIELQKGTKDGGIDIIAIQKKGIFGAHKYLIQAKKWKNKVGVEPVQQLAFLKDHYKVSKACLATTSTFTKGAWNLAKMYPWQLELKDYNGLLDWIKLANITSP